MAGGEAGSGMPGMPPGMKGPEDLLEIMNLYKQSGGEMDPNKVPPDVRPFVQMFQTITEQQQQQGVQETSDTQPGIPDFLKGMMDSNIEGVGGHGGQDGGLGGLGKASSNNNAKNNASSQEITPEAGFVVKCRDDNNRKIFINMCGSELVHAPGNWEKGKIPTDVLSKLESADIKPDESLRFPLSLSDAVYDLDKQGAPCTTYDCIFNLDVLKQAMANKRLKVFLIELALGWVQEKHHLILNPQYKLPRMKYKGQNVQSQNIRKDAEASKPIIEEIRDDDRKEAASFPLMTSKRKHTVNTQVKAKQQQSISQSQIDKTSTNNTSSQSQQSHQNSEEDNLDYSVEFEGKPFCVKVNVRIMTKTLLKGQSDASIVDVDLVDKDILEVCVGATKKLKVELPFAVDGHKSSVQIQKDGNMLIGLPYKPLEEVIAEMKLAAPHKFGTLNLSDSSFLDLE